MNRSLSSECGGHGDRLKIKTERLAAIDHETVSTVLARELRDFVSVHAEWLSAEVPGFKEALAWPTA